MMVRTRRQGARAPERHMRYSSRYVRGFRIFTCTVSAHPGPYIILFFLVSSLNRWTTPLGQIRGRVI